MLEVRTAPLVEKLPLALMFGHSHRHQQSPRDNRTVTMAWYPITTGYIELAFFKPF